LAVLVSLSFLANSIGCEGAEPPASSSTQPALAGRPPNIILILTDDLNEEVFNKNAGLKTLLTESGTHFRKYFTSVALCCPSRAATLRGQYAHNSGIFTNNAPDGGFAKFFSDGLESSTVATWLRAGGYKTALIGKYLNGYPSSGAPHYIPNGWSEWYAPNGGTPYAQFNYNLNENGTTVSYGSNDSDYFVDVISRKTAGFIKRTVAANPSQPFFIYVAPTIPHGPATPPTRYADHYPDAQAPRSPSFNEADVSDKPAWVRSKALLTNAQKTSIDELYRKRRASLLAVEDLVRDVIDTLTATGQLGNTYIFFASDNGFHQGQHRLTSGKNTAYEEDINVPLIVRGPGVPAGAVIDKPVGNIDLAPTFAALAGVTPPAFVDGRSLVPFLTGATPPAWRLAFLLEHGGPSITLASNDGLLEPQDDFDVQALATGAAPVFAGIRTITPGDPALARLTYVEYDTGERELYDNSADPDQLVNAYSSASAPLKARLSTWVGSLRHASGSALRAAEEALP
jgi:arylsulfatase A-like enzyme